MDLGCLLLLTACETTKAGADGATNGGVANGQPADVPFPLKECLAGDEGHIDGFLNAAVNNIGNVDAFLDCVVGKIDANDKELHLLRGHIVVSVIARYGLYNVDLAQYANAASDAASLMDRIEIAEELLRGASKKFNTNLPDPHHPNVDRLDRVAAVLNVSLAATKPTKERVKSFITRVAALVGGGAGSIPDLLEDALRGVKKLARLRVWGGAYRQDTHDFLARFSTGETVEKKHWEMWDKDIEKACLLLAAIADAKPHCIPENKK